MKNLDYTLVYASATFSGYGHYRVEVELQSEATGDYHKFYATTTDMRAIDEWKSTEDLEEVYKILFDCIEYDIQDEIIEWLYTEQVSLKEETYLFENVAVVTKDKSDYKTLGFVSGNTMDEVKNTVKEDKNYRFRNNGIIEICFDGMESVKLNSNKF